jgi:hypothetical protein
MLKLSTGAVGASATRCPRGSGVIGMCGPGSVSVAGVASPLTGVLPSAPARAPAGRARNGNSSARSPGRMAWGARTRDHRCSSGSDPGVPAGSAMRRYGAARPYGGSDRAGGLPVPRDDGALVGQPVMDHPRRGMYGHGRDVRTGHGCDWPCAADCCRQDLGLQLEALNDGKCSQLARVGCVSATTVPPTQRPRRPARFRACPADGASSHSGRVQGCRRYGRRSLPVSSSAPRRRQQSGRSA